MTMVFEKATIKDIDMLTELRLTYLQEDLGEIADADLELISSSLPSYYEKHLNKDLIAYVGRRQSRRREHY